YNEDPFPITAAQAYDATKIMLMALSKSGPDSAKLRDAIEALDGFKGVTSAPSKPYGTDRHHSLEGKDMFAAAWKNGELVKAQYRAQHGPGRNTPARAAAGYRQRARLRQHLRAHRTGLL